MIRFFCGVALLSVLSIFVIPAVLITTAIPVEVVYIVPFALCIIALIKRLNGSEPRKGDELAKKFGVWVAARISKTFDLQPRPEPTMEERLIAVAVGTAAVIALGVVAYLYQAAPRWYGVIFVLWLVAMFTAWGVRRPNLQQPNDGE
ncbi:hypothetical protein [Neorhizobium alkalisoli]|jgi:hypothetical protein|uniref:Uncharacterized protein n=1 Tax=Neorhizobium alkalisoli TaxID=528178 RepID=A0A561PSV1_9HYPH|nr:hypothetical protein [Neorhizobium alkalisoli]TWF41163.1 hypothetical protein FHW37_1352 [Neorhizobium alkalisoli]